MADQDFFSTNVPASNPKPGHTPESTDSFAKAIQSRFSSSSLTLPPPLHLPSTSGSKKKPSKHGFSLSTPAPTLSLPTPVPVASSSASSLTIPTHSSSLPQLLCSAHPPSNLDQFINDPECLILDIRSHAAFTTARLTNALSLSVPSTLLKRPLYSLDKLALMLSSKSARNRFSAWAEASSILIYDADSLNIPEGSNLHGLLRKFRNEGYPSEKHLAWLQGGFVSVWRERKDLVVSGPDKTLVEEDDEEDDILEPLSASQSAGLLRASALPSSAFNLSSTTSHRPSRAPQHSPTQSTLLLSAARTHSSTAKSHSQSPPPQSQPVAFNPFYDTVRQNLELSQGVSERIPLTLPASVRERIDDLPFRWLRHVARRAAPASKDYTPLDRSAENTEEDTSSSSSFSSSSSSACDSDPDTTPPLFSPDGPRQPEDLIEEGTEALAMQFYRIELGEQRRLMGIMQHHSSESGRVMTSSSGTPSSEEILEAPVPRVRHHKSRLNRTEVSFPYSITAGVEKGTKNRYRNIWPFEHARVHLLRSSSDDYINASFVQPLGTYKRYIATQGPLEATLSDFWTLVWEQNVHVIVMLTQEVEGMHVKCCNYWDSGQYGPFLLKMVHVENADERQSRHTQPTEFSWNLGPSSPPGSKNPTITRRLELSNKDFPSAGSRNIVQMQYLEWPDLNVPDDPRGILDLATNLQREVNSIPVTNPTVNNLHPDEADPSTGIVKRGLDHPPVLLHCSAGVGRTGGFIAIDAILDGVRREVRKRRAAILRRKGERRNREIHESSQSPPFGTDRDVDMSDSKPSPPQENMVLDDTVDTKIVRPTDVSLVMPIHGTHGAEELVFHVPVVGWTREDGGSGSGRGQDQSSEDLSSQRDSPSPSEQMDIDEKERARSKPRRQKLEQTSPWTSTRRELKEWPANDDSHRPDHLVRPHVKRLLSDESDVHQTHSDRSSSSGDYRLAFASGSATGSSSSSDLNLPAHLRKSVATQQSESQMADVSTGAVRRLSPPTSIGSSSDSNYRARTASTPGTLSSSPAPPPPSTYPSPSPKRPHHRHRQTNEITGRLSSPLGSSEDYSTGPPSVFGLANRDETTAVSSHPSSHKRTSDEGSAKVRQHSSRSSSDRDWGTRHEVGNTSRSQQVETIGNNHPRPFDYADPRAMFVDEETPPLLSTFGEPIRRILEDMREQRMSLCQSLRQYVFVHRAIIEGSLKIVDEEREREKEAKSTRRKYADAHVLQRRPSLSEVRHTTSYTEQVSAHMDMQSATQPIQFVSNPLLTAGSSTSISASDHSSVGFFMPIRNAKRNASPTELVEEDTIGDSDLSKRPSTKRRHTEDVKERPTRAGGPMSPVRATAFTPYSGVHHHSSTR